MDGTNLVFKTYTSNENNSNSYLILTLEGYLQTKLVSVKIRKKPEPYFLREIHGGEVSEIRLVS